MNCAHVGLVNPITGDVDVLSRPWDRVDELADGRPYALVAVCHDQGGTFANQLSISGHAEVTLASKPNGSLQCVTVDANPGGDEDDVVENWFAVDGSQQIGLEVPQGLRRSASNAAASRDARWFGYDGADLNDKIAAAQALIDCSSTPCP